MDYESKVGPRQDEDLKRGTRGGEDAKHLDLGTDDIPTDPRSDVGDETLVEERSALARSLEPSAFPAGRDQLVEIAEANFAPDPVLERLRALPENEHFDNVQQVWEASGG